MRQLIYGLKYVANYWMRRDSAPLICGLVLHNRCNLRCRHCTVVERDTPPMTYNESVEVMDAYYAQGGRCLYLEGGEPFIWKDDPYTMEDVVRYARKKGYLAVIIYTNGTRPLQSEADTLFVSLDGTQEIHDSLRGESFERIATHIQESSHPSIYINYTINSVNQADVAAFCAWADPIPQIKGTFFYFHTPYYGYDELFLDQEQKTQTIRELIALKRRYRILNSVPGLKSAIRNDWKKRLKICQVYEGGKFYTCCRESHDGKVCRDCGYLSYAEIDQTLKLRPGAIINAMKYF